MAPVEPAHEGLNAAVAAELRGERAAQNLTVQELAARSEVPYASLRRYLSGERDIDVAVLAALAAALGTTPARIVVAAEDRMGRESQAEATVTVLRPAEASEPKRSLPSVAKTRKDRGENMDVEEP